MLGEVGAKKAEAMIDPDDIETEEDLFKAVFREPLLHGTIGQYEEAENGKGSRRRHQLHLL